MHNQALLSVPSTPSLPVIPGVRNRHRWTAPVYRGLPVMPGVGPFVAEQLETVYQGLLHAKQVHPRLYALRFDLRFPDPRELLLTSDTYTNDSIRDFWKRLKSRIEQSQLRAARAGARVHPTEIHYIWAREYGAQSGVPHYHCCLLLNGHAFAHVGEYELDCDNLYTRIVTAWTTALGLPAEEFKRLVSVPNNAEYMVRSGQDVASLFHRLSYFAKLKTKRFDDGQHCVQRTRVRMPAL